MGMESAKRSGYFTVDRWVSETLDIYGRLT
jgi:hypothetical protein